MELGIKVWKGSRWSNCIVPVMQKLKCGPYLEVDKLHIQASAVPVVRCSLFLLKLTSDISSYIWESVNLQNSVSGMSS